MGFIPIATPDMGALTVEVRRESFYLGPLRGSLYGRLDGRTVHLTEGVQVELYLDDIDQIIAALRQAQRVHQRGEKYSWVDADGNPVESVLRPDTVPAELLEMSDADKLGLLGAVPSRLAPAVQAIIAGTDPVVLNLVQNVLAEAEQAQPVPAAVTVLRAALDRVQADYLARVRASGVVGASADEADPTLSPAVAATGEQ